jgi:hypothetical protein
MPERSAFWELVEHCDKVDYPCAILEPKISAGFKTSVLMIYTDSMDLSTYHQGLRERLHGISYAA